MELVSALFRLTLAATHSPQYQDDHRDSLAQDWAHVPVPRPQDTFDELAEAGEAIATLLDPARSAEKVVREVLGENGKALGVLSRTDGRAVRDEDRVVRHAYFGAAKGKYAERLPRETEPMQAAWGEATGDLFINEVAFFQHVPAAVWRYELGGYPVLKKWLGYRQASRRDGQPLSVGKARHARSIIQRVAAMLVLHERLDDLYSRACADAWTAEELGLR